MTNSGDILQAIEDLVTAGRPSDVASIAGLLDVDPRELTVQLDALDRSGAIRHGEAWAAGFSPWYRVNL